MGTGGRSEGHGAEGLGGETEARQAHPPIGACCLRCSEPSSGAEVGGVQGPTWPGLHGGPKAEVPEPDP